MARLITGLGNARSLNRRYIADYVSKKDRTKASAGANSCHSVLGSQELEDGVSVCAHTLSVMC